MNYVFERNGYANKDARIANAVAFCDTLGGDEYDAVRHYIDCTGVIPEWLAEAMRKAHGEAGEWHRFVVTHKSQGFEVVAKSERAAINQTRYNLYETRPLDTLPPFTARFADERNFNPVRHENGAPKNGCMLTRSDIAARIRRMAS